MLKRASETSTSFPDRVRISSSRARLTIENGKEDSVSSIPSETKLTGVYHLVVEAQITQLMFEHNGTKAVYVRSLSDMTV